VVRARSTRGFNQGILKVDFMTAPVTGNPLSQMLNNAFTKLDRDGDNKLNADEFADFNQVLMPGLKLDDNGKPTVDMQARMDHNGDGFVDRDEMNTTGVLMPADMCDPSLGSIINYLHLKGDDAALRAMTMLESDTQDDS
jgi:Ca2+-binding EF-hand superfamily protein